MLASGGNDGELIIWSVKDRCIINQFYTPGGRSGVFYDVNWSHDGQILAGGNNEKLVLLDIRNLSLNLSA